MNDDLNSAVTPPVPDAFSSKSIEDFYEAEAVEEREANHKFNEINLLNDLGNLAVSLKLIGGHGFHRDQYELLRDGTFLLMTPIEAQQYLEELIAATEV
jgi:hypothetical protein